MPRTTRAVEARRPRHLLTRLLDTPHLAEVVRDLEPRVLHQLVRYCGLEDCGEIVSLATTEQLMRVFDDDLWRSGGSHEEDQFDADRFGLWLEVLAEAGVPAAAKKIAEMDFDFVTAALSRYLLVLDQESLIFGETTPNGEDYDPIENARAVLTEYALEESLSHEIGGYGVIAKRSGSWDALLSILTTLEVDHPRVFGRLMKRVSSLSTEYLADNGGLYEVLTADEQVMNDIAGDRERRREQEGYVTPPQAAAFLKLCRQRPIGDAAPASGFDPVTAAYFRELEHRAKAGSEDPPIRSAERQVTDFLATLHEAGVVEGPRLPLIAQGAADAADRLSRIRAELQLAMEQDSRVHSRRMEELGYLANVLIAGCSFGTRQFRPVEAADAVLATCNLGLENWPPALLLHQDLVAVFRAGWLVLHERVGLYVATRLVETLSDLRCDDEDVQEQVGELCRKMSAQVKAGTPWRARDDLDVIATLDQPSWAALLGLINECPVVPKAAPAGGPRPLRVASGFDFISEGSQIAWVRDFALSLPERLR